MMTSRSILAFTCAMCLSAGPASGQEYVHVRSAVLYENYKFDSGLGFRRVAQLTVPVGVTVPLGRFGNVALSGGYSLIDLAGPGADQRVSGALDTEVRLSFDVIPGRLVVLATGAIPTGIETVAATELPILGIISSDIIGFSAPSVGSGGNLGGGFVAAVPAGRWAFGFGATVLAPLEYQPVRGVADQLRPGGEARFRGGIEGPLGRRTYLRIAGMYALRQKDELNNADVNGVGNRAIGYFALNQGIGNTSLTVFAFDVFRTDPRIEQTATGAAALPRGNLFSSGAQLTIPIGGTASITPRYEGRLSHAAPDITTSSLDRLGTSHRFELKVRKELASTFALVAQGSGVFGDIQQAGNGINFSGYRLGLHLEVSR